MFYPRHALPIEMNIKLIYILTISLFKIVSYYVFPEYAHFALYLQLFFANILKAEF